MPHCQLLQSLADIGISGQLHRWFANYLSGRHQRVVLEGFSSSYQPVTSGVPQGSILGSLMYIIFVNSLSKISLSPGAKIVLYADDILLYRPINCVEDNNLLQSDVNSILEWVSSHGLVPNHAKTKLLNVTRSRHPISTDLNIDRVDIPPSSCVKYLGVTLSAKFTWSDHVSTICKSSKRQI